MHIAILTDRLAIKACMHPFDFSTFEAFLMKGKVTPVAVRAYQLAGLTVKENFLVSFTDTANTFHKITSFQIWFGFVFKRAKSGHLIWHHILHYY